MDGLYFMVFFVHACLQKKKRNPYVLHNIIYTSHNISSHVCNVLAKKQLLNFSDKFGIYESMYDWKVQYLFQAVFFLRSPYGNRTVSISKTYGFHIKNVRF